MKEGEAKAVNISGPRGADTNCAPKRRSAVNNEIFISARAVAIFSHSSFKDAGSATGGGERKKMEGVGGGV